MSKQRILDFLRSFPIMNIATINKDKPLSSVVLFYVDNDFNFYFLTQETSYKAKSLIANNQISFSVWNPYEMIVQADGNAEVFADANNEVLDKIVDSLKVLGSFWPPLLQFSGNEYMIFRIKAKWLRALDINNMKVAKEQPSFTIIDL